MTNKISGRVIREMATFFLGAFGFVHEVLLTGAPERPFVIAASLALMGLPFVLRGEEKLRD